jgi:hypothetical protein
MSSYTQLSPEELRRVYDLWVQIGWKNGFFDLPKPPPPSTGLVQQLPFESQPPPIYSEPPRDMIRPHLLSADQPVQFQQIYQQSQPSLLPKIDYYQQLPTQDFKWMPPPQPLLPQLPPPQPPPQIPPQQMPLQQMPLQQMPPMPPPPPQMLVSQQYQEQPPPTQGFKWLPPPQPSLSLKHEPKQHHEPPKDYNRPPPPKQHEDYYQTAPKFRYPKPDHGICIQWIRGEKCSIGCHYKHEYYPEFKKSECKYYEIGVCNYKDSSLCSRSHGFSDPLNPENRSRKRGRID